MENLFVRTSGVVGFGKQGLALAKEQEHRILERVTSAGQILDFYDWRGGGDVQPICTAHLPRPPQGITRLPIAEIGSPM
jgi:hypothetical protein